jgi:peroxiredoxin
MAKRRKGKSKHYKKDVDDINDKPKKGDKRSSERSRDRDPEKKSKTSKIDRQARKRREDIIFFTVLIIIVASIFGSYFVYDIYFKDNDDTSDNGNPPPDGLSIGEPAPYFELEDTDGVNFTLNEYIGNIVIINFVMDSNILCHDLMLQLNQVNDQYEHLGVKIISIGISDNEPLEQIRDSLKMAYLCQWRFAALGGEVAKEYDVGNLIPVVYIVDQQGTIVYKNAGITDAGILEEEVNNLLQ